MPIYEYRCSECGFQDEFLQKISEPQLTVCPKCGKETLRKLLSAAGFQLKGSGWYATDFRNSGSKSGSSGSAAKSGAKKEESKPESGGETKGEAKSEAKPETKSETKNEAKAA